MDINEINYCSIKYQKFLSDKYANVLNSNKNNKSSFNIHL